MNRLINRFGMLSVILMGVILRAVRIWSPNVQIEDPNYIYGGYLMFRGMIPFRDFAQPNPPLLETILSVMYRIFGVSYRVPELLTGCVYILTAVLVYHIGRRWFSPVAGFVAACLYSVHYLPMRYHLFEREVYATAAVLAGLVIAWGSRDRRFTLGFLGGLAMGLGYACKQTAIIQVSPVIGVTALLQRDFRRSLGMAAGFVCMAGGLNVMYMFLFGNAYLRQTFWFHFIKGTVAPWWIKASWTAAGLGFLIPIASAAWPNLRRIRHPIWIVAGMILSDLVFFWFISGAFWPHYLLSTLVPVCLMAGSAVDPGFHRGLRWVRLQWITAGMVTAAFCLFIPGAFIGKGAVSQYGFDGTPRKQVMECARHIRAQTRPDDLIISDPFIALAARRIKVIRFKDNWGLVTWMNRMIDAGRYREALAELSGMPFGNVRKWSQKFWMPLIRIAFSSGKTGAVVPNYELAIPEEDLLGMGFRRTFQNRYYTVWTRSSREDMVQTGR